jgi:hypothetical protein
MAIPSLEALLRGESAGTIAVHALDELEGLVSHDDAPFGRFNFLTTRS